MNVNDKIQDKTIHHMVYLERYKLSEVRRILKVLNNEIIPEINEKLNKRLEKIKQRGTDVGKTTADRLKQLEDELLKLSKKLTDRIQTEMTTDLKDLSTHETEWQAGTIKKAVGFNLETVLPNPTIMAAIIKRTSFAGLTLDNWFGSLERSIQRNVMIAVNRGMVEGETTDQIMRRIRGTKAANFTDGVWQTTRRQVEAITRTTVNHVSTQVRIEFFKENDDIIEGLKWIATLDSRTSVICAGLDGKVFPIDKGPRPPAHVNCRSTMTAVLKSAEEIGINKIPAGKRASMNGQVPASTTYGEWLKKQPVRVQEEVLGVKKAKLFRDGNLPIDRFTDSSLKPLSLERLRALEKNAFKHADL